MDSVDILDRVDILVFQFHPGHFSVDFKVKEKEKHLVFDETALKTLQDKVLDLTRGKNAKDPNTVGYIQEYVGRLIREYHKVGLAVIEDIPDSPDDHYAKFRNLKGVDYNAS